MPSSKGNALLAAVAFAAASVASVASAQQQSADPAVAQRLSQVQTMTQNTVQVAQLAQKKAQAPAAKNLANQIVKDYTEMQKQLQTLASQRGIPLNQDAQQAAAQSSLSSVLADLNARSGADFDRAFIDDSVRGFEGIEQALKDLREATPGQDAQIKGWLDQAENVAEASVTQARSARQQVATAK
jgi:putative membrane protein